MDLELILLIPLDQLARLNLTEIMAYWAGEVLSRTPREFQYGTTLHFRGTTDNVFYQKLLGSRLDLTGWIALYLKGDSLSDIAYQVNTGTFCPQNNELIHLIHTLYSSPDPFCLIKLLYEEEIHHIYIPLNSNEAIDHLIQSLNWENPTGIALIGGRREVTPTKV